MKASAKSNKDAQIKEILDLIARIAAGDLDIGVAASDYDNGLNEIAAGLHDLAENMSAWDIKRDETEKRLNTILDSIVSISALDFKHKAPVGDQGDIFDAVAVGLNALGEELEASTVSREFLDNILVSMVDSLIILDQDVKIRMVNQAALDMLGYTQEELLGQSMDVVLFDDEIGEYTPKQLNKIAFIRDKEIYFENKYGTRIPVSYSLSVLRDTEGRFQGAVCVGHDITARKKADEERSKWAHIFQHAQSGVAVDNEGNGILDMVNPAFAAMLGYEPDEMIGMPVIEVYAPEFLEELRKNIDIVHRKGSHSFEALNITKLGTVVPTIVNATAVKDEDNNILYRVVNVTDISEQKESEEALRESETRFRTLFEQSPFGVMLVDPETTALLEFNESMSEMLGYSKKEFGKLKVADIEVIENSEETRQRIEKFLDVGHDEFETKLRTKDGRIRTVVVNVQAIDISGKIMFLNIVRDITESKRADQQIKASLAEKEVLLQEIHHRVKNNLQIISSLLYLQTKRSKDKGTIAILQDSQNRIKAMSLIHEKLYQTENLSKINMEEYILSLVQSLFTSFGVTTRTIGLEVIAKDVYFGVDLAIPCGVIINELVSNSLKHAFSEGTKGAIWIEISSENDTGWKLRVRDDGVGFPKKVDPKNPGSLGLQLVENLANQLGGNLELRGKRPADIEISFTETKRSVEE